MLMLYQLIYPIVATELLICFFIHSLAPPFVSPPLVPPDLGVDALGPPEI